MAATDMSSTPPLEGNAAAPAPAARDTSRRATKRKADADGDGDGNGDAAADHDAKGVNDEMELAEEGLSHKERRKRKKMEKKRAARMQAGGEADEEGGEATKPAAAGSRFKQASGSTMTPAIAPPALPPRSKYSIWVGNLSFRSSAERLQDWLQEKGIQGISRVHMPAGVKKFEYNRGFAYVDLPDKDTLESAVGLSESHFDGRRLLIKSGSDYSGRPALPAALASVAGAAAALSSIASSTAPEGDASSLQASKGKTGLTKTAQKILRAQKNPPGPTLFVGNLGFEATSDGLRELVERNAKMRSEGLIKEKEKGKRKERAGKKEKKDQESSSDSDSDSDSDESDEEDKPSKKSKGEKEGGDKKKAGNGAVIGAGIRKIRMGEFEDSGKCKGFGFIDFHTVEHATATLLDPRNGRLDGRELTWQYAGADAIRRGAVKQRGVGEGGQFAGRGGTGGRGGSFGARGGRGGSFAPRNDSRAASGRERWEVREAREKAAAAAGGRGQQQGDSSAYAYDVGGNGQTDAPAATPAPAPEPGSFDPTAPLPKKHKETQEERRARREREAAAAAAGGRRKGGEGARQKPGAALANAQRAPSAIVTDGAAKGKKISFD